MAQTATKDKPDTAGKEPTGAQRVTITTLTAKLGIEPPDVATQEDATKLIEELTRLSDESAETPGEPDPSGLNEDEEAVEAENEPAQPSPDDGLSAEASQKLFDRAVDEFGSALRIVFDVEELQPSQTPGVIGFVLPGFTEMLPHSDFTRCSTCNGYGDVLTGSMKAGDEKKPCPDPRCKGRGYWQKAGAPEPIPAMLAPMPQAVENGGGEWGEAPKWMGDPNLTAPSVPGA